jgi:hypothetical protein
VNAVAVVIAELIFVYEVAPEAFRYTLNPAMFVSFSVQSTVTECCVAVVVETLMLSEAWYDPPALSVAFTRIVCEPSASVCEVLSEAEFAVYLLTPSTYRVIELIVVPVVGVAVAVNCVGEPTVAPDVGEVIATLPGVVVVAVPETLMLNVRLYDLPVESHATNVMLCVPFATDCDEVRLALLTVYLLTLSM